MLKNEGIIYIYCITVYDLPIVKMLSERPGIPEVCPQSTIY